MQYIEYKYRKHPDNSWLTFGSGFILETQEDASQYMQLSKQMAENAFKNFEKVYNEKRDKQWYTSNMKYMCNIVSHYYCSSNVADHISFGLIRAIGEDATWKQVKEMFDVNMFSRQKFLEVAIGDHKLVLVTEDENLYGCIDDYYKKFEVEIQKQEPATIDNMFAKYYHLDWGECTGYYKAYILCCEGKCYIGSYWHYVPEYIAIRNKIELDKCIQLIFDYNKGDEWQGIKHVKCIAKPFKPTENDLLVIKDKVMQYCDKLRKPYETDKN